MKHKLTLVVAALVVVAGLAHAQAAGPVVASTSWTAAFGDLAGLDDVQTVAPANLVHPPEYELTASDIDRVAKSQYFLYAGYERMMKTLGEAAGHATLVKIQTDTSIDVVKAQVALIVAVTHTAEKSAPRLASFVQTVENGRTTVAGVAKKRALVHVMQTSLAKDLGLTIAGTFGPGPVTAAQLADAKAKNYELIIDNIHNPVASPLLEVVPQAKLVLWRNFPLTTGRGALQAMVQANIDALVKGE